MWAEEKRKAREKRVNKNEGTVGGRGRDIKLGYQEGRTIDVERGKGRKGRRAGERRERS